MGSVIHPFILAVYPVLFLYSHNIGQISTFEVFIPVFISLCFTTVILIVLRWIMSENHKAGLVTSLFLLLFFSYGHLFNIMLPLKQTNRDLVIKHLSISVLGIIVFYLGLRAIIKLVNDKTAKIAGVVNIIAFSLVVMPVIDICEYALDKQLRSSGKRITGNIEQKHVNTEGLHDIYYIILDGYTSVNVLKNIYNYDNSDFLNYLEEKGFYVVPKANSNYAHTQLSLAASLISLHNFQMEELKRIQPHYFRTYKIYKMIKENYAVAFLKSKGYKYVCFSTGWGGTHSMKADVRIYCGMLSEFHKTLFQTTILRVFEPYYMSHNQRKGILKAFSTLAGLHKIKGPKYVFAHILSPHPPFIFDEQGGVYKGESYKREGTSKANNLWMDKEGYVKQVIFINRKIRYMIDELLTKSDILPVIILQGDHGPRATWGSDHSGRFDDMTETMLKERMGILNAYFLPDGGKKHIYSSITPVNTFRFVFDHYFNAGLGLIDDRIYFSTTDDQYKYHDVTDRVRGTKTDSDNSR